MASPAISAGSRGVVSVSALPGSREVLAQQGRENFPVALRILRAETRTHLLAIYGFARLVDEIGDRAEGDRLAMLDAVERDLTRIFESAAPEHPLLRKLVPSVRELGLPAKPFRDLIEANRRDQSQVCYASFDDLVDYCRYSASPIGVLVLRVFRTHQADREPLSDAICTALQLAEHWQDVAEDHANGRTYLPEEDLERFGVDPCRFAEKPADEGFRALMCFEVERARDWLERGEPLLSTLRGRARMAVAAYAAGGHAALDAIADQHFDVLSRAPRTRRLALLRHWLRLLWRARR